MVDFRKCSVEGCGSGVLAKGLCSKHYDRVRRLGSTELQPKAKDSLCTECGERFAKYANGLCQPCYRRDRNKAKPARGVCEYCGTGFETKRKYTDESKRGRFCSRDCKEKQRIASGRAAEANRKYHYMAIYGLTLDEVETIRALGCAICPADAPERVEGRWGNLHIDHDHDTGRVRGALCNRHNVGLGHFGHDVAELLRAVEYLTAA